jgi:hypothetical protein
MPRRPSLSVSTPSGCDCKRGALSSCPPQRWQRWRGSSCRHRRRLLRHRQWSFPHHRRHSGLRRRRWCRREQWPVQRRVPRDQPTLLHRMLQLPGKERTLIATPTARVDRRDGQESDRDRESGVRAVARGSADGVDRHREADGAEAGAEAGRLRGTAVGDGRGRAAPGDTAVDVTTTIAGVEGETAAETKIVDAILIDGTTTVGVAIDGGTTIATGASGLVVGARTATVAGRSGSVRSTERVRTTKQAPARARASPTHPMLMRPPWIQTRGTTRSRRRRRKRKSTRKRRSTRKKSAASTTGRSEAMTAITCRTTAKSGHGTRHRRPTLLHLDRQRNGTAQQNRLTLPTP